jgi:hypothetical protein
MQAAEPVSALVVPSALLPGIVAVVGIVTGRKDMHCVRRERNVLIFSK